MTRRLLSLIVLAGLMFFLASCTNKHVQNPIANVDSKQPDKVLFDRAMDAMKHNRFDVARITLQTLINTYPDSEFVARAKLAVGDSWYAESGSAGLAQAEIEYKDFITFFPNMPEAAEAQLKVANIHYRQMEKPDRDFTHAKRAEEEYRQLILQFPDSKLVPEAKRRLLEVQEVLAEREYRIGRFYYLRESWPAAIARLKSLTDTYPLYSKADEALFMLGDCYEKEVERARATKLNEAQKGKIIRDFETQAAEAYSKIITRYPVMDKAAEARKRLEALHRRVPTPTPEAIAQNKAEEASRSETGRLGRVMLNFHRHPDVAEAAKVGEPTLVDPRQTSATEVARRVATDLSGSTPGASTVAGEIVGTGTPPPNQPTPHSDSIAAPATTPAPAIEPETTKSAPAGASGNSTTTPAADSSGGSSSIPELVPNVAGGTSATPAQPSAGQPQSPAPPDANNDAAAAGNSSSSNTDNASSDSQQQQNQNQNQDQGSSSSKKKKKKKFGVF